MPFEQRKWKNPKTFTDYVYNKVILANRVPIPEEEKVVDCIINDIL